MSKQHLRWWRTPAVAGGLLWVAGLSVAEPVTYEGTPGVADETAVVNLARLARREPRAAEPPAWPLEIPHVPLPPRPRVDAGGALAVEAEPREAVSHTATPLPCTPAPADTFQALDDNNALIPPDTHGAAGPNHLMTTLNTEVRIQNKSGGVVSTVNLASFWSALSNPAPFDPKVLYDPFQNRWIFVAMADACQGSSSLLIGASQSNDPTGNWNLFRIDVDAQNLRWADYPSIGFNRDWVVVNLLMVNICTSTFASSDTFVFNKTSLYSGTATFTRFQLSPTTDGLVQVPAITYDNNLTTLYALQSFNGNDISGFGFLRLYAVTSGPSPCSVANPCFNAVGFIATGQRWDPRIADNNGDNFADDIAPQCGTTMGIHTNDDRIQNVVYRNNDLWAAQMVYLPPGNPGSLGNPNRTSVQWWEIGPSLNPNQIVVRQRALIDDATAAVHHIFPSISVNSGDDALIGYSLTSGSRYASCAYSFRDAADQAGTLRPPFVFKSGESSYHKTSANPNDPRNRWGDYSHTVVDPVNDSDFWTIQEYADTPFNFNVPGTGADRWATQWALVGPAAAATCPSVFDWVRVSLAAPAATFSDGHAMAHDGARGRTVLYRGDPSGGNHATWEWDGCTWTAQTPAANPGGRVQAGMVYDGQRQRVVLYGGWDGGVNCPNQVTHFDDTWEYDGTNWSQVSAGGAGDPPPRLGPGMAYDAGRGVTVLYGGAQIFCDVIVPYNDTWEYNGTQWTQKFPATTPSQDGRCGHAMAYDPIRGVTVLHGGTNESGFVLDETWEYNGTNWTQRFPNNTPGLRTDHAMVFDATRGVIVLYGGPFGDSSVWEWNGTDWRQAVASGAAGGRQRPRMAYDLARRETVLFEGLPNPGNSLPETFVYPRNLTRAFCLSGTASGAGWSWCLEGAGFEACDLNVPGVSAGSPASALAAQFAASINGAGCAGLAAGIVAGSPQCFTVTVNGGEDFNLLVGAAGQAPGCCMTTAGSCSFNPEMTEVPLSGADCNGNLTDDALDIAGGASTDADGDGVPDECQGPICPADLDGDLSVGILDFLDLLAAWGACPEPCPPSCVADLDGDCTVGILDFLALLAAWGPCD